MTSHVAALIGHDCLLSALSPADYKVLSLLQKGCAYQVRGAWRFRGSRTRVKERALVSVLEQGLAEGVETNAISAFVRDAGCHVGQGWLYGPAVPPEVFLQSGLAKIPAIAAPEPAD